MKNLLNLLVKLKDSRISWKYILIVVILTFVISGWFLFTKIPKSPIFIVLNHKLIPLDSPWQEYHDSEFGFRVSFPTMIKFGNAFIKPYIKEHHYHELEEIYGIYKEILILSDNPKFPDVTDQLFRISVMRNPHQRPLRLFLMIFYPTLKEEEMKEISFKGFNAMQLNFGQSVEIFIAKEKLVYALYPGQVTWAKRGKDRVFFPLQSTSLWEQFINSFSP